MDADARFPGPVVLDHAVSQGEQCVVTAAAYVAARQDLRATLADEDRANGHFLTAVPFDTQAL